MRDVTLGDGTSMWCESVCPEVWSQPYVNSIDICMFDVTCLDFQDGCNKGAVSLRHILCRSHTKCTRSPGIIQQVFGEQSLGWTQVFMCQAQFKTG